VYDPYQGYIYIPYDQISEYSQAMDTLWIQRVEIFQQDPIGSTNIPQSLGEFWIIIGALAGLEMDAKYIDIFIKRGDIYIPINEIENYQISKFSFDYDIPMAFHPSFKEGYISDMPDLLPVLQNDDSVVFYRSILSVFSHLTNIRNNIESFYLKLNDVMYAQLSPRYTGFPFEVEWKVSDSFTHEVLHQTNDRTLKYRYKSFEVIDIEGNFKLRDTVNGTREFTFFRQSVASYIP
jgi:hypothetical protein